MKKDSGEKKNFVKSAFEKLIFTKTETHGEKSILGRTIKKLIYIIVILLPLWFLPITVNAVDFNKQFITVFLVVITLILWLAKILSQGEIVWKKDILNIAIGAFAIIYVLATFFSLRPYSSLVGWPTHLSGALINILTFIALYLLIVNNFKGLKETFGLIFAFLVSSALAILIGFIQLWGGFVFPWDFTKITSFNTIGTANSLGIFSAVILVLITALLFVVKRAGMKAFLLISGLLSLIILLSLNFWILWVILGVGMAIVLIFSLMRIVKLEENIAWVSLPMTLLALCLIFILFQPAIPLNPSIPVEVGLTHSTGLDIIKETLKEKPILGTGPETFVFNYSKFKPEELNQTSFWNVNFSNPPAEIYSVVSDTGILGIVAFLVIMILFIVKAVKNLMRTIGKETNVLKRFLEIGLFAGWFSLLVAWFLYPQNFLLMFIFWLLFSLYLAESSIIKKTEYSLKKSPKILLLASFSFVILIVVIVGLLYVQGTRFVAEIQYNSGVDLVQEEGEFENGLNKIIKSTVTNPYEDRSYTVLSQLFLAKLSIDYNATGVDEQEKLNLVQVDAINAINSAVKATELFPENPSNWLNRGEVYAQVIGFIDGADEWAEKSFRESLTLEPSNPYTLTELGKVYMQKANLIASEAEENAEALAQLNEYLKTALEAFDRAIELKPDYSNAHYQSAVIFDAQGRLDEAIAKMEINRELLPSDTGIAFQLGVLYYKAQRYQKAGAEFVRAVVLDPDYANARYFLGILYDQAGDKESALDQFERIANLNPDNEHIKQIIANLKAGLPALGSSEEPEELPINE